MLIIYCKRNRYLKFELSFHKKANWIKDWIQLDVWNQCSTMAQLQNVEVLLCHKTHLPYLKLYCNRHSPIWMKNISHHQANTRIWNRSWLLKKDLLWKPKFFDAKTNPWNINDYQSLIQTMSKLKWWGLKNWKASLNSW